jgi:hypothetical protein
MAEVQGCVRGRKNANQSVGCLLDDEEATVLPKFTCGRRVVLMLRVANRRPWNVAEEQYSNDCLVLSEEMELRRVRDRTLAIVPSSPLHSSQFMRPKTPSHAFSILKSLEIQGNCSEGARLSRSKGN